MMKLLPTLAAILALFFLVEPASSDRLFPPRVCAYDSNGNPLSGAKLFFYEDGTFTPKNSYSDNALSVANTNPVIASSAGCFGEIFLLNDDYRVVLQNSAGVAQWTADPVRNFSPDISSITSVTTTTSLATADDGKLIAADATAGGFTITLPAAATAGNGYRVGVIKTDSTANVVTIDANGSETINGASDLDLTEQNASVTELRSNGSTWYATGISQTASSTALPPGHIDGFTIAVNGTDADHDLDIGTGSARDSADGGNIRLDTALVKRIDAAFAAGTNQGCMDTGAVAASTLYYLWAIATTGGTADFLCSLSASSPTMPSSYTLKRIVGFARTDASANIGVDTLLGRAYAGKWALPALPTATGTSITIATAIPAGANAVDVLFNGVSTDTATQVLLLRLGDSGGIETTGYVSSDIIVVGTAAVGTSTAGIALTTDLDAAETLSGRASIVRAGASNTWVSDHTLVIQGQHLESGAGVMAISDALTQLSLTTAGGSAAFDAGEVYVVVHF